MKLTVCTLLSVCALLAAAPVRAEMSVRGQALVLDFPEAGFKVRKNHPHVYWDADNDGQAEKCRWFSPEQALLAIDRDGDGLITDSAELFGSIHMDGFAALRLLDTEGDKMMTPADRINYSRLRAWFDVNSDGRSTPDEIKTFAELGVGVINMSPAPARGKTDAAWLGAFERRLKKRVAWQPLAAVNLFCDEADVKPLTALVPKPAREILVALPDLPGAGKLPSLQEAMALDYAGSRSLMTQVRLLTETNLANIFAPERPLDAWIDEIFFRWAGAGEGDRLRAGMNIDGRKLVFLAKITGRADYLRSSAPSFWDIYAAELTYRKYQTVLGVQLALQTPAAEIFAGYHKSYDRTAGMLRGVTGMDENALKSVQAVLGRARTPAARRRVWAVVADMVDYVIGFPQLTVEDGRLLDAAVKGSGDVLGLRDVMNDALALMPHEIHAARAGEHVMSAEAARQTTLLNMMRDISRDAPVAEEWFHGPGNALLNKCCFLEPEWELIMRDGRFKVTDISKDVLKAGALPTALGYDRVLLAERTDKHARLILTGYFSKERLQWSELRVQPTSRK